ncbi:MAG TPA: TonB-dependent receptor [Vitreimonas sp.]|uniref:TonB-dependent receptor n=1 Tax=Vitreimonas sp. TaxID=3069702 RepID=UPI002D760893|nr:TonB-dependent receptor [Vitreimonas sp.]HYD86047.1 TonB-dependent receptor [Vitreimonas sp.]
MGKGPGSVKKRGVASRRAAATLVALLAGVSPIAISTPASAQAQRETVEFDIPAQPVGSALVAYARQAGVQLVMTEEPSSSARSNPVHGPMRPEQALSQLLQGTGYNGRFENGAVRLRRTSSARDVDQRRSAGDEVFRLASPAEADRQSDGGQDEDEPIVVLGTNIRGIYPSSSPVDIYTAEEIARTGATTTEQFIRKLPQNFGGRSQNTPLATSQNREAVNAVDLRGLGVGTTLTLLNGRRLGMSSNGQTSDVSLIPVSAVARVEVLTDGASAIYGSDAVGGVVNFVLRDDFDGAETRLTYGGATNGGMRQGNFSQTVGRQWNSGNGLISVDASSASPLESEDRDYAAPAGPAYLTPVDQRYSGLATLSQELGERTRISADLAFSVRESKLFGTNQTAASPASRFTFLIDNETEQAFANVEAEYQFDDSITGSFIVSYANVDTDTLQSTRGFLAPAPTIRILDKNHQSLEATLMLDGTLLALPGGDVRFSAGGGFQDESYLSTTVFDSATALSDRELGRRTTYAFGELYVPIVGEGRGLSLVESLELSLAARYTNYEDTSSPTLGRDFGDSISPKVGVHWRLTDSVALRATYGESFRAPSLSQLDPGTARTNIVQGVFSIGGVVSPVIQLLASPAPDLEPETAETYTIGADYRSHRGDFRATATYFNIDYHDRIGQANVAAGQVDPAAAPEAVYRPLSAAQLEEFLRTTTNAFNNTGIDLSDPHAASLALFALPNLWISDARYRNLAVSRLEGIDVAFSDSFDFDIGTIALGGQLTQILAYDQQDAAGSPVNSVVDTPGRPVSLRARLFGTLTRERWDSTLNLNYVDDYVNPRPTGADEVESWTTVDWTLSYRVREGTRFSLSVQNLFDEDPPFVGNNAAVGLNNTAGFDPANADPLGRFVVFGVAQTW